MIKNINLFLILFLLISLFNVGFVLGNELGVNPLEGYEINTLFDTDEIIAIYQELDVLIFPLISDKKINVDNENIIILFLNNQTNEFQIYNYESFLTEHQANKFENYFNEYINLKESSYLISNIIKSIAITLKRNLKDDVFIVGEINDLTPVNVVSNQLKSDSKNYTPFYIFAVALILILFLIHILAKKEKSKKFEDEEFINIRNYLQENLNKGYDLASLKLSLVKHGYNQTKIEEVSKLFK